MTKETKVTAETTSAYTFSETTRKLSTTYRVGQSRTPRVRYDKEGLRALADELALSLNNGEEKSPPFSLRRMVFVATENARIAKTKDEIAAHLKTAFGYIAEATDAEHAVEWQRTAPRRYLERNERKIADLRDAMAEFAKKITSPRGGGTDAFYEFSWADREVGYAAELNVRELLRAWGNLSVGIALHVLRGELLRAAGESWSSTSVMSNLTRDKRRVALAEIVRDLESHEIVAEEPIEGKYTFDRTLGVYVVRAVEKTEETKVEETETEVGR